MKKTVFVSLLLAVVLFGNLSAQIQHFSWQGTEREYLVRTPASHDGTLPVLFFLLPYHFQEIFLHCCIVLFHCDDLPVQ